MRRRARSVAVGPDDGIARQYAAPPVIAGDVVALTGADLRHCGGGAAEHGRGDQKQERDCAVDGHAVSFGCGRSNQSSPPTGFRFIAGGSLACPPLAPPDGIPISFQLVTEIMVAACCAPLAKSLMSLQERALRRDGRVA